jgi:hypothetical protein
MVLKCKYVHKCSCMGTGYALECLCGTHKCMWGTIYSMKGILAECEQLCSVLHCANGGRGPNFFED